MTLTMNVNGPHRGAPVLQRGMALPDAAAAMILVHGRGASAQDIMTLTDYLGHPALAYLAPQATNFSWYPYSFLMPTEQNEPHLSSALALLGELVSTVERAGIPADRIILAGFSQGACLSSEFLAREGRRFGGLLAFSGGLIGPEATPRDYPGSLGGTPAFVGCSDRDAHIPLARVQQTAEVLARMGATVDLRIYPNMPHTIIQDEFDAANLIVEKVIAAASRRTD